VFTRLEANANDHHAAIFEAIRERDSAAAGAHMRAHIEATRTSLHDLLPSHPAIELVYFAVVGTAWGLPLFPLLSWMNKEP
jgi:hypothetical protein